MFDLISCDEHVLQRVAFSQFLETLQLNLGATYQCRQLDSHIWGRARSLCCTFLCYTPPCRLKVTNTPDNKFFRLDPTGRYRCKHKISPHLVLSASLSSEHLRRSGAIPFLCTWDKSDLHAKVFPFPNRS